MMKKRLISGERGAAILEVGPARFLLISIFRLLCLITILYFVYQISDRILTHNCDKNTFFNKAISNRTTLKGKDIFQDSASPKCKTIHLASVVAGFNSTRNFRVLLKSILFYRTDKIHLHLLVDNLSKLILVEIFNSWQVEDLNVTYYNATDYEHQVSWIPSGHYSHRFGLIKLAFPTILAENTDLPGVVLIDTDMIVMGNIRELVDEMKQLFESESSDGEGHMFGMVENQSDWYLANNNSLTLNVWPALGRGFNSGLILVNLRQIKRQNWRNLWRETAERELFPLLSAPLADQDIFNAIFKTNPELIRALPCSLNLQVNDHNRLDQSCPVSLKRTNKLQIIHWNSPIKYKSKSVMAEFYQSWFTTFTNWNGALLKHSPCLSRATNSNDNSREPTTKLEKACQEMRPKLEDNLRTHLYYLEYDYQVTNWDVTYVVHLSFDRLPVLDELASHWSGPIIAAVYLSEQETDLFLDSIENSDSLLRRKNIAYHLVYRDNGFFNYPINRLRNIALNNTLTPFVLLSDIDLLPSYNLYEYLKQTLASMASNNVTINPLSDKVLVIPAFENNQYKYDFPPSKEELLKQLNLGMVSMFRQELWPRGHTQTDYSRWKTSTQSYGVQWKLDYEPFIVASRNVPRYDERFVGFGFNKVEHIMELASLKYQFQVLPDAFLIHKFHSPSYDILRHRNSFSYKQCIKLLRRQFLVDLNAKRPEFFEKMEQQSVE